MNAQVQPSGRTDGAIGRLWCPSGGYRSLAEPHAVSKEDLELSRSVHHWDERNRLLSPENGIGLAIEVVE